MRNSYSEFFLQEERLNCAFETMLNYVEHLKLLYDKEHLELEEYRRLLAEHNLLPGEKGSLDGEDPKVKGALAPRSLSLSSSSKPVSCTFFFSIYMLFFVIIFNIYSKSSLIRINSRSSQSGIRKLFNKRSQSINKHSAEY